jgi:hypothetical protein
MKRRDFLKLLGITGAIATTGVELLPSRTIFLPPRMGWWQPDLKMREVVQYLINDDAFALRFDVAWGEEQHYVEFAPVPYPGVSDEIRSHQREMARRNFLKVEEKYSYERHEQRLLALPRGVESRYV